MNFNIFFTLYTFETSLPHQIFSFTYIISLVVLFNFFLYRLLNAFAEEAALEDAIYYMGEALRCGIIDLEIFLRQVRTLSRKQFMLRALMQKCRQKAGLAVI